MNEYYYNLSKNILEKFIDYLTKGVDMNIIDQASYVQYATYDECFRYGYYTTSLLDLFVGGIHRGKLYKRKPKELKSGYRYYFDNNNKLIAVDKFYNYKLSKRELFLTELDKVYGLEFRFISEGYIPDRISEFIFENDKIVQYSYFSCCFKVNSYELYSPFVDLCVEKFFYEKDKVSKVSLYDNIINLTSKSASYDVIDNFHLLYDENGNCEKYYVGDITKELKKEKWYEVLKKNKDTMDAFYLGMKLLK